MMRAAIYTYLMSLRRESETLADAHFFALCVSHRATDVKSAISSTLGLAPEQLSALLTRYFPELMDARTATQCMKVRLHTAVGGIFLCQCHGGDGEALLLSEENSDLQKLLLDHRAGLSEAEEWSAAIIATACFGDDHLWQDLGLTEREDLSAVIKRHFPRLHLKNSGNMKWKKFLYKRLCDQAAIRLCQAPNCSVCDDYARCFGPENASGWNLLSAHG
ncbi:nitrogen fixation protein NifQ [Acidithiobacillus ferrivorans]|nr:nitrogen fixation protein NifQ [Acidithiobacillus ferrivorans]